MLDLKAVFTAHKEEYQAFEKVENARHERPDLCAFLMLHDLAPRKTTPAGQNARFDRELVTYV